MSDKNVAFWSIQLHAECPSCKAEFDLIDQDSFRESGVDPLGRVKDYEVTCPRCEHEFLADLEY